MDIGLPLLLSGGPGGPGPVAAPGWSQAPTLAGAAGAGRAGQPGVGGDGAPHWGSAASFPALQPQRAGFCWNF